jgi:hypothetical protein
MDFLTGAFAKASRLYPHMKALAVNYTTEMKSSTNFLQDI